MLVLQCSIGDIGEKIENSVSTNAVKAPQSNKMPATTHLTHSNFTWMYPIPITSDTIQLDIHIPTRYVLFFWITSLNPSSWILRPPLCNPTEAFNSYLFSMTVLHSLNLEVISALDFDNHDLNHQRSWPLPPSKSRSAAKFLYPSFSLATITMSENMGTTVAPWSRTICCIS